MHKHAYLLNKKKQLQQIVKRCSERVDGCKYNMHVTPTSYLLALRIGKSTTTNNVQWGTSLTLLLC